MKFSKSVSKENDRYNVLLNDLRKTSDELKNVYNNLENVSDPDLIDYYIYQAKAVSMRYKFLLNCAKKIEDSYTKNPL